MLFRLLYLAPECCCSCQFSTACNCYCTYKKTQKRSVLRVEKTSNLFFLAHSVLGRLEAGAQSRNTLGSSAAQIVAYPLPWPGCARGFIFPSLLVACSLSDTPLSAPDVLLTASFTLAMSVIIVQITQFWNPIRLYPPLLFSGISFSCGWDALRMGHWTEGLGLSTVTQSLSWGIKLFLWKIAAVVLLMIHSAQ